MTVMQIITFASNIVAFIVCSAFLWHRHRDLRGYQKPFTVVLALANLAFVIMRIVHWPWLT